MKAFSGCTALDSIEIPVTVKELDYYLFDNTPSLKSITLPFPGHGTVESFGNFGELFGTSSFDGSRAVVQYFENGTQKTYYIPTSLEELTILDGCGMIPYGGLSNCNMLKRLTIPASVYLVGDKALYGCAQITDIYCQGAEPPVAFDSTFDGMRFTSCKLHVPYNSADLYRQAEGWRRFTYIQEDAPIEITITKNIENAGAVFGLDEYRPGATASLRAVANSGYTFDGWYEGETLLTTADVYEFAVIGSRDLVAQFLPVVNDNPVDLTTSDTSVTLTWPLVDDAASYIAAIYTDPAMSHLVDSRVIEGEPSRAAEMSATFDGLATGVTYYYSIRAMGANSLTLSRYDGTATTGSAGIGTIAADEEQPAARAYINAQGAVSATPWHGLNIVLRADGTTAKQLFP